MLKMYISNASHKILQGSGNLGVYLIVEKPLKILDTKVKVLRIKTVLMVKVLCRNYALEEASWEVEVDIKIKYSEFFPFVNLGVNFL